MNQTAITGIIDRISKEQPHSNMLCNVALRAFTIGSKMDEFREKVAKDPRLTEVGRREKVAETAKGMIREALDAARPQRSAMAQVIGQRMHMKPKPLERENAVAELRRQELRAFVRSQPPAKRLSTAIELAEDDEALSALMDAPAALSGLPVDQYGHLRDIYVKRNFGDQIARLDVLEEDCTAAGAAIEMLMTSLRQASGLNEYQFDELVKKTQSEIDAR